MVLGLSGHIGCVVSVDARNPALAALYGQSHLSHVVSAAEDGTVRVWDVQNKNTTHIISHKEFNGDMMGPVRVSNSDNTVVASVDNVLFKFDLRNTSGAIETATCKMDVSKAIEVFLKNRSASDIDRCIGNFELFPHDSNVAYLPLDSGETVIVDFSDEENMKVVNRWQTHSNVADTAALLYSPSKLIEMVSEMPDASARRKVLLSKSTPKIELWSGSCDCKAQRLDFQSKKTISTFDAPQVLPALTAGNTTATGSAGGFSKGGAFQPAGQMVNPPFVWSVKPSFAQTTMALALGDGSIALYPVSEACGAGQLKYCTALAGHFNAPVSHICFVGTSPSSRQMDSSLNGLDSKYLVGSASNSQVVVFERKAAEQEDENAKREEEKEKEEGVETSAANIPRQARKAAERASKKAASQKKKPFSSPASLLEVAPFGLRAEDFVVKKKFKLTNGDVSNAMVAYGEDKFIIADTTNVIKIFDC